MFQTTCLDCEIDVVTRESSARVNDVLKGIIGGDLEFDTDRDALIGKERRGRRIG